MNMFWTEHPVVRGKSKIAELWPIVNGRGYIAGSWAAWACSRAKAPWLPRDIDIFATSEDNAKAIVDAVRCSGRWDVSETAVAFTIKRTGHLLDIQVVRPSPEWRHWPGDLLESFDLSVSRAVLVAPGTVMGDADAGSYEGKILRTNNPLRSLKRVMKYNERKVTFHDHELLKLFRAWDMTPQEKKDAWITEAAKEYDRLRGPLKVHEGDDDDDESSYGFYDDDDWFEGE